MANWDSVTLGDVGRSFARYRPFVAVVAAVFLLTQFGAGEKAQTVSTEAGAASETATTAPDAAADTNTTAPTDTVAADGGATATGPASTVGSGRTAPKAGAPKAIAGAPVAPKVGEGGQLTVQGEVGPDCDTAKGRIKVPSRFAPPCAPPYKGDNGGAAGIGVEADKLRIVWYFPKSNPAAEAALSAAGANDPRTATTATVKQYVEYFKAHFETYGRKIELIVDEGTADAGDDAAGRADAVRLTGKKPFIVINAANNGMVDKLAEAGIVCICTTSQPQEFYASRSPYAGYTTLMSSTQAYIHRAEYIGKRLNGRKAKYAGTRDRLPMNTEDRVFGLLWYETADKAYKSGIDFFKKELAEKYNVRLKVDIDYRGYPDVALTQQAARPAIQRLKGDGVNSVIFAGDPIGPGIFTAEATRQDWFPEWIITGSALTDTTLFARTYAKEQWDKAFGVAMLAARFEPSLGDSYRLLQWHSGQAPAASNTYPVIYAPIWVTFMGVHMAGPRLTPKAFQQGLFNYPVTGRGGITSPTISYGNHGIWPFTDYTQFDDMSEIWWDNLASGKDEVGHEGPGMYRWVDFGKRYLPGEWPSTDPKPFVTEGTVTFYNELPPGDRPPTYPREPARDRKY